MGLSINDKRDLTVTGGLPYFGGPGNSYTMFSTAEMVRKLRTNRTKYGMVTANSWFLTKHAVNIFSSNPPVNNSWELNNINIQKEIDSKAIKNLNHSPMGTGIIETYTIINGRDKLKFGIVIGRLNDGSRFIANTPKDEGLLQKMIDHEMIGKSGEVYEHEGKNIFKLGLL
jgi:acetyl-CoA C-acetyltransferase